MYLSYDQCMLRWFARTAHEICTTGTGRLFDLMECLEELALTGKGPFRANPMNHTQDEPKTFEDGHNVIFEIFSLMKTLRRAYCSGTVMTDIDDTSEAVKRASDFLLETGLIKRYIWYPLGERQEIRYFYFLPDYSIQDMINHLRQYESYEMQTQYIDCDEEDGGGVMIHISEEYDPSDMITKEEHHLRVLISRELNEEQTTQTEGYCREYKCETIRGRDAECTEYWAKVKEARDRSSKPDSTSNEKEDGTMNDQGRIIEDDMDQDGMWVLSKQIAERIKDIPAGTPFLINLINWEDEEDFWGGINEIGEFLIMNDLSCDMIPLGAVYQKPPYNKKSIMHNIPAAILRDKFRENLDQPFLTCTILNLGDPTSTGEDNWKMNQQEADK